MTTTVKLTENLENALRMRCAQEGRSLSEVMRDALTAYLAKPAATPSAWDLGEGVFGRFAGPVDLAENRKNEWAQALQAKHESRS